MTLEQRVAKLEEQMKPLVWEKEWKDKRLRNKNAELEFKIKMMKNPEEYGFRTIKWL